MPAMPLLGHSSALGAAKPASSRARALAAHWAAPGCPLQSAAELAGRPARQTGGPADVLIPATASALAELSGRRPTSAGWCQCTRPEARFALCPKRVQAAEA